MNNNNQAPVFDPAVGQDASEADGAATVPNLTAEGDNADDRSKVDDVMTPSIATVIAAVITNLSDDQSKAQKYAEALVTANAAKTTRKPGSTVKPGDLRSYGVDTNYKASTVFKGHLWKQSLRMVLCDPASIPTAAAQIKMDKSTSIDGVSLAKCSDAVKKYQQDYFAALNGRLKEAVQPPLPNFSPHRS